MTDESRDGSGAQMQHVEISDAFWERAHGLVSGEAGQMGNLQGSIENGGGNFAGLFGELLFVAVFGGERNNTYDHDIDYRDQCVDVKTKRRSVRPEPFYDCSITDYNTEQDCDWYYFVSVQYDYSEASLLGYLPPDEYYERATFREEGDVDPDNGFVFKADCWNVDIANLWQLDIVNDLPVEQTLTADDVPIERV
jgi:hypothetical protein